MASIDSRAADPAREHIRGSSLLLAGRFVSLVLNFLSQVLIVRYLTKADYGAFAFVLAMVQGGASVNLFGFHKTVARFLSIYEERGEYGKMFGAVLFSMGTLLTLGLAVVLLVHAFPDLVARVLKAEPLTLSLVLLFVVQLPVEAADLLLVQLLAVFAGARSIFFRRHVLGPGLRVVAVLAVMALHGDVRTLALAYLSASVLGIAIYVAVLLRVMRRKSLLGRFRFSTLELPVREILGFSLPLASSDLLFVARSSLVVYLLEYFHPTTAIAEYRAVVPVARLNTLVQVNFLPLFLPLASRLFSRGDRSGIERMHWQTSVWIMVLTFPVFAGCTALAGPLTSLLFGERYLTSAPVLAVMATGIYVYSCFAFNVETMKVLGKVRYVVAGDLITTAIALVLNLTLIPAYGAIGAAIAVAATLLVYSVADQVLLSWSSGMSFLEAPVVKILSMVGALSVVLALVEWALDPPFLAGAALVAAASLVLLRSSRSVLRLEETFPEIARHPIARLVIPPARAGRAGSSGGVSGAS